MEQGPEDTIEFGWFGQRVRVSSSSPALARLIRRRWGTLAPPERDDVPERRYRVSREGVVLTFAGPDGTRRLDRRYPGLHAYNLLLSDLLGQVGEHFVFHGSAVARDGAAVIIAGPSTFGKTTLAIEMTRRGLRLLGDDVTVLERASGRVLPFTRSLNLRPGTRDRMDDRNLEAVRDARFDVFDDEWAVDPVRWLGAPAGPSEVAVVAILRPHADGAGVRRFPRYEILIADGHDSSLDALADLAGVVEIVRDEPWLAHVVVDDPEPLTRWLREHEPNVVSAVKYASGPPDFDGEPRLEPIGKFQAALELTQEMLNRHVGSALDREYRDREALLVADVATALRDAQCYALLPGRLSVTIELMVRRFREATR